MVKRMLNWFDDRTSYRTWIRSIWYRDLPGGPRWRYTTASALLWVFVIQVITGLMLMASYSPSTVSAWASVYFIESSSSGAMLRGLHYWAGQVILLLLLIHLIRVFLTAAFRAPREIIWITGLIMLPLIVVIGVTGNPLPGSQKAFEQIKVESNIAGSVPVVGPMMQRILLGGSEVGNLTLTNLYSLHVAVLPLLFGVILFFHLRQVLRHAHTPMSESESEEPPTTYFPNQSIRNMVVVTLVVGIIGTLALVRGAPLDAPLDAQPVHSPRPEWYFLFLFELRSYFSPEREFLATIALPKIVMLLLMAWPLVDRLFSRRLSAIVRATMVVVGLSGFLALTAISIDRDRKDENYQESVREARRLSARAVVLADRDGIPPEGAASLLRTDPQTQGPRLFASYCASCHSHTDAAGYGIVAEEVSASNLYQFASRAWIRGLLDPKQISSDHYFGATPHADGEMVEVVEDYLIDLGEDEKKRLEAVIVALSFEAALPYQEKEDQKAESEGLVEEGVEAFSFSFADSYACTDCHLMGDEGEESAPDLTGYGSEKWLIEFLSDPADERFYGASGEEVGMPSFYDKPHAPLSNRMSMEDIRLLVRWLRDPPVRRAAAH